MEPITMAKLGLAVREAVRTERTESPEISPELKAQLEKLLQDPKAVAELHQDLDGDEAEMHRSNPLMTFTKTLDGVAGQGMPWGSALIGGGYGLIVSEVIDGITPPTTGMVNWSNIGLKLGAAWVSANFLGTYAGRPAGNIGAGVIIFSLARQFTPIENAIQWLIDRIRGVIPASTSNNFGIHQGIETMPLYLDSGYSPGAFNTPSSSYAEVVSPY